MGNSMSLRVVLIAVVSIATPAGLHATWQEPIGPATEQQRHERIAQDKRDTGIPGGLPGRAESSEESTPRARARATKAAKPAAKTKDSKNKDKPGEGGKKKLEGIQ
jgi:hypothetical protein